MSTKFIIFHSNVVPNRFAIFLLSQKVVFWFSKFYVFRCVGGIPQLQVLQESRQGPTKMWLNFQFKMIEIVMNFEIVNYSFRISVSKIPNFNLYFLLNLEIWNQPSELFHIFSLGGPQPRHSFEGHCSQQTSPLGDAPGRFGRPHLNTSSAAI